MRQNDGIYLELFDTVHKIFKPLPQWRARLANKNGWSRLCVLTIVSGLHWMTRLCPTNTLYSQLSLQDSQVTTGFESHAATAQTRFLTILCNDDKRRRDVQNDLNLPKPLRIARPIMRCDARQNSSARNNRTKAHMDVKIRQVARTRLQTIGLNRFWHASAPRRTIINLEFRINLNWRKATLTDGATTDMLTWLQQGTKNRIQRKNKIILN